MALTVLMNAGPWLPIPPNGYGGIENVVATLVPELRKRGVRVVLATVGTSTLEVDDQISVFDDGRFAQLLDPYNRVIGVAPAHLQRVLAEFHTRDDIDLVHDHVEVIGLSHLAAAGVPALHTLHWDLAKHREFYSTVDGDHRVWVNGVSADQLSAAPPALLARSLGHVHLSTPLAENASARPLPRKEDHVVVLGRLTPSKGQHIAVRVARKVGRPLMLAGPVGPYHDRESLERALATEPAALTNPDVRFWCDEIAPYVDDRSVHWLGTVTGPDRERLLATASAALFPITWNEPGGTAVTESLALGCPVVGFGRGCLPELIDHGRTGMLAEPDNEVDLAERLMDCLRIDPTECVREAEKRFQPAIMADHYVRLYERILTLGHP